MRYFRKVAWISKAYFFLDQAQCQVYLKFESFAIESNTHDALPKNSNFFQWFLLNHVQDFSL